MIIRFYGTRGSIPSPGIETIKYGGNTSCVEVISDQGVRLFLDAGTGIRTIKPLKYNERARIFFSHSHWDHLQGLPFFGSIYNPEASLDFLINKKFYEGIKGDLIKQMSGDSFPIKFENLPCDINFIKIDGSYSIDDNFKIEVFDTVHPGGSTAIKIINGKKTFTFATDNEIQIMKEKGLYKDFVDFCKDSYVLAHDGQYSNADMRTKRGWGHSSIDDVLELFVDTNVKIGLFTHHDPIRTDVAIEEFENFGLEKLKESKVNTMFFGAKENEIIEI